MPAKEFKNLSIQNWSIHISTKEIGQIVQHNKDEKEKQLNLNKYFSE